MSNENETADDFERRDFIYVATGAMTVMGTAFAAWPFIDSMNPSADVLSLATTEIDISSIEPGQRVTAIWRSKPVFIDRRTPDQIEEARIDDQVELRDPQTDAERVIDAEWLVVVGVCTHLGCVPLGQKSGDNRGEFNGWFCPCHGSHYDTSGRIRKGPAPTNLVVPPYTLEAGQRLLIG